MTQRSGCLALLLATLPGVCLADRVELRDGRALDGTIVSETPEAVTLEIVQGSLVALPRDEIKLIRYSEETAAVSARGRFLRAGFAVPGIILGGAAVGLAVGAAASCRGAYSPCGPGLALGGVAGALIGLALSFHFLGTLHPAENPRVPVVSFQVALDGSRLGFATWRF